MRFIEPIFLTLIAITFSCTQLKNQDITTYSDPGLIKGDSLINEVIEAYGGQGFENSEISFLFRGANFKVENRAGNFLYERNQFDSVNNVITKDILTNSGFKRLVDDSVAVLDRKAISGLTGSVNSVAYFTLLPWKLKDPAVQKRFLGSTIINGNSYEKIQVTFEQDGGGEDYQDIFLYYIDPKNNMVDYIAYKYHVNGGGARFRKAIGRQQVNGLTFQNYENYDADTVLDFLKVEAAYLKGLKKLKNIENTDFKVKVFECETC